MFSFYGLCTIIMELGDHALPYLSHHEERGIFPGRGFGGVGPALVLIGLSFIAVNTLRGEGRKREAMAYGAAVAAALQREYVRTEYRDKTALVAALFPSARTMPAPGGGTLQGRSCEGLRNAPSFRGIRRPNHVECLVCVYSSTRSTPDANNPVCPRSGGTLPFLVEDIRVYTRSSFSPLDI